MEMLRKQDHNSAIHKSWHKNILCSVSPSILRTQEFNRRDPISSTLSRIYISLKIYLVLTPNVIVCLFYKVEKKPNQTKKRNQLINQPKQKQSPTPTNKPNKQVTKTNYSKKKKKKKLICRKGETLKTFL